MMIVSSVCHVISTAPDRNAIIIPALSRMSRAAGAALVLSNLPCSIFSTGDIVGILGWNLRREGGMETPGRGIGWRDAGVRIRVLCSGMLLVEYQQKLEKNFISPCVWGILALFLAAQSETSPSNPPPWTWRAAFAWWWGSMDEEERLEFSWESRDEQTRWQKFCIHWVSPTPCMVVPTSAAAGSLSRNSGTTKSPLINKSQIGKLCLSVKIFLMCLPPPPQSGNTQTFGNLFRFPLILWVGCEMEIVLPQKSCFTSMPYVQLS